MYTLIACLILSTLLAGLILRPFFTEENAASDNNTGNNIGVDSALNLLLDQKSRFLQMLRDLELDYSTSKLSEADYNQSRHELSVELAGILKKLDELGNPAA